MSGPAILKTNLVLTAALTKAMQMELHSSGACGCRGEEGKKKALASVLQRGAG